MVDSVEGLLILVLTMPGFLGYLCFNRLREGCVADVFEKIGIVVGLNVAALIIAQFFLSALPPNLLDADQNLTLGGTTAFAARSLFVLTAISVALGAAFAMLGNAKWVSAILLRIGLTRKSSSKSVIADVIRSHPSSYFKFTFKSGGYVMGHPRSYSLDGDECVVFLEKAAIRTKRSEPGGETPARRMVSGPGIMLLNFDDVKYVELI